MNENGKRMKLSLLAMAIVLAAVVLMTIVPVTAGPSDTWTCYLEPQDSTGECDAPTIVSVKINITHTGYYGWHDPGNGVCSYQDDIHYDLSCVNVTDVDQSMAPFLMSMWHHYGNFVRILSMNGLKELPIGVHTIANLTLECNSSGAPCSCNLTQANWEANDEYGEQVSQEWIDGTYTCMAEEKPDLVVEKSVTFKMNVSQKQNSFIIIHTLI